MLVAGERGIDSESKVLGDLAGPLAGQIRTQLGNPGPEWGIEEVQVTQDPPGVRIGAGHGLTSPGPVAVLSSGTPG